MIEFAEDIQDRITRALLRLGISDQVAGMVGAEIVIDLARTWHGEQLYISATEIERARIRDEVRRRFNGRNAREIAREMGIGKTTVYRIIKIAGQPAD